MKICFTPRSSSDIEAIKDYLKPRSRIGLRSVLRAITAAIDHVQRHPFGAPETDKPAVRAKVVSSYSYTIFYRIREDAIELLHIHHDSLPPWKP